MSQVDNQSRASGYYFVATIAVWNTRPFGGGRRTVEARGFKKYTGEALDLRVNQDVSINVTLEVGDVGESVTVTAEAPLLEAGASSVGRVVNLQY